MLPLGCFFSFFLSFLLSFFPSFIPFLSFFLSFFLEFCLFHFLSDKSFNFVKVSFCTFSNIASSFSFHFSDYRGLFIILLLYLFFHLKCNNLSCFHPIWSDWFQQAFLCFYQTFTDNLQHSFIINLSQLFMPSHLSFHCTFAALKTLYPDFSTFLSGDTF